MPNNGTHFDIDKHLPLTPYSLPLAIWDTIESHWSDRNITFTQTYPKEDVKQATIVWDIFRRVPGAEQVESLGTRYRGTFQGDDGQTLQEQYAQWQTIIYRFTVYDTTNQEANQLLEDLEALLYGLTGTLQQLGVTHWLFDEQPEDIEIGRQSTQEVYKRVIKYRCILEKKFIKIVPKIQQIWLRNLIDPDLQKNEAVIRGNTNRDLLSNRWVTQVVNTDKKAVLSTESSGAYIEDIDFKLDLTFPYGKAYIEWLPKAKHPNPGETYYITYFFRKANPKTPVTQVIT